MTLYDSACVENFIMELRTYVARGGSPPVVPPLENIDLMDALGDIAGFIVTNKGS